MGGESEEAVETAGVRVVEVAMGTAAAEGWMAAAEGWTARVRAAMVRALGEVGTATAAARAVAVATKAVMAEAGVEGERHS